jgi:hydrogenase maturation protease
VEELTTMAARPCPAGLNILVIGYGNTLRADDGAGQRVAAAVAEWAVDGLASYAVHQLTPELAEPLASAELAIFVDARLDSGDNVDVQVLEPSRWEGAAGHTSDPGSLLALAHTLYGRHPRSWLLTVPAADFSLGEPISSTAERGVQAALVRLAALIEEVVG